MKHIVTCMVVLMLTMFAGNALAYTNRSDVDTSSLTPAQVAQLKAQAAQLAAENVSNTGQTATPVTDVAERWVNIGAKIGVALAASARELGLAANDFLRTPAGMIAVGVIVYQYIGHDIITICLSATVLLSGFIIGFVVRRTATSITTTYDTDKVNWVGNPLKKDVKVVRDEDLIGISVAIMCLGTLLSVVIIAIGLSGH